MFSRGKSGTTELFPFADMHCHVLPGVDDGSKSMEMSLKMLKIAASENISKMILTPHYVTGALEHSTAALSARFEELKETAKAEGIGIELYLGNELFCSDGMEERLRDGSVFTLAGSKCLLIEFFRSVSRAALRNAVLTVKGAGLTPVIAHVERYYELLDHPEAVLEFKELGALIQVNVGTVLGYTGNAEKRFARELLRAECVDFLATDAHNVDRRAPRVQEALKQLYKKYDRAYVRRISYENTCRLLGRQDED